MATYTYDAARGSNLDKARELLGGTRVADATADDPGEALRSDEDIQSVLDREGFVRGVAWLAASLLAEWAQQSSRITAGGKTIVYDNLIRAWETLSEPLRRALATQGQSAQPTRGPQIGQIAAGTTHQLR